MVSIHTKINAQLINECGRVTQLLRVKRAKVSTYPLKKQKNKKHMMSPVTRVRACICPCWENTHGLRFLNGANVAAPPPSGDAHWGGFDGWVDLNLRMYGFLLCNIRERQWSVMHPLLLWQVRLVRAAKARNDKQGGRWSDFTSRSGF